MIHTFNAGDGASVIDTIGTNDTIQIEVVDADLTYTREGDNLVIKYTDSDTVTLTNYFNGSTAIESTTAFYDIKVKAAEDYTSCNLLEQIIKVNVNSTYTAPDITTDSVITGGFNEDITSAGATTGDGYKIYGNHGNDILRGSEEADKVGDWLEGGDDNDTIYAGSAATIVRESETGTSTDFAYNYLDGGAGNDEIHGSDGVDIITGGTGDDTIYGGSGNDIFVYSVGDGHDVIKDSARGDILRIDTISATFQKVQQVGENLVLTFDENNTITIENFNYSDSAGNIDTIEIKTAEGYDTLSFSADVTFTKELANNETYNKTTPYHESISLADGAAAATVSGMTENDKISVDGAPVYSRTNNGGLVINSTITISDFNFDGEHDINVNEGSTAGMTVNVTLADSFSYTATGYNEIFTGIGTISGITKNDNINIQNAEFYRTGTDNVLRITGGGNNISVNNYDYTQTNKAVKVDGVLVDYSDIINVNLDNKSCTATQYTEIFTGSGSISNMANDDKIVLASETTYTLKTTGLEIKDDTNTITVTDYTEGNEPVVEVDETADDVSTKVLYVEGLTSYDGTNTPFANVEITGTSGADTLKGSSADDIIAGAAGNDTLSGNGGNDVFIYHIGDGHDTIKDAVTGDIIQIEDDLATLPKIQFVVTEGENDMGMLIGNLVITFDENNSITVENFDYANTTSNFDTIKINRGGDNYQTLSLQSDVFFTKELSDGESYTKPTSPYHEKVMLSDGAITASVNGLNENDRVYVSDSPVYTRKNSKGLIINNQITVSDFFTNNVDFNVEYGNEGASVNTSTATINVVLQNEHSYFATRYNEIFTGEGSVTGISANDNIAIADAQLYCTAGSDILTVSDGDSNIIKVMNYDFDTQGNVKVNGTLINYTNTINVNLNNKTYEATRYKEVFTGSGKVSGLTADDNISVAGAQLYRTGNSNTLTVSDGTSVINVTDYNFAAENTNVKVNDTLVSFSDTLNVDLNGTTYTGTTYHKVFTGSGNISKSILTTDDNIALAGAGLYRTGNTETLIVSDGTNTINVTGYSFTEENTNVKVNGNLVGYTDTVNVDLNGVTYSATDYKEVFAGSGNVSGLSADDKLTFTNTTTYTHTNETGLVITDNTNTITVTDYAAGTEPFVTVNGNADDISTKVLYVEGFTNYDASSTNFSNVDITGTSGNDTYTGSIRNDVITGAAGDDTLYGGGGNDTFVYTANGGHDVIKDANLGDTIQIDYVVSERPDVRFVEGNFVLTFDENNSITVENFDYADTSGNIDAIKFKTGDDTYQTLSIAEDIIFTKELADKETYNKTTPYRERISLADGAASATVTGLDKNDEIYVADSPEFSRTNNDGLVINNAITVSDFFTAGEDIDVFYGNNDDDYINTSLATVNVTLTNGFDYTCTTYKEVISGSGSVAGMSENDKISVEGTPVYTRTNDGDLVINGNITVKDFDFNGGHDINVNDGTTAGMTVNVTLTNSFDYTCTTYNEVISGSGSVAGMTENDKISVDGTPAYSRTNDGNLVINNAITVRDFNWDGEHDINVNEGSTEGMTVNVTLTDDFDYTCTTYNEVISGTGSVTASEMSEGDKISVDGTPVYTRTNDGDLVINGNITVKDFDFNGGHDINVNDGSTEGMTVNVTLADFSYTATDYNEIFTGVGSVTGIKSGDNIAITDAEFYRNGNDNVLRITNGENTINVTDYDFTVVNNRVKVDNTLINYNNTINVDLNGVTYSATGYNEVFTGSGSVSGLSANDNIAMSDAQLYRTGNDTTLRISNGVTTVNVTDFSFNAENTTVKVDGNLINYNSTINVALAGAEYSATGYKEIFTGSGSVTNLSNSDKLTFTGATKYTHNTTGLVITDNTNTITVSDYTKGNEPVVEAGGVADDISTKVLYVEGLTNFDASITEFANVNITGTSSADTFKGSTADDIIRGAGGDDTLYGGGGNDTFIYAVGDRHDTIKDQSRGDIIQIDSILTEQPKAQFVNGSLVLTFDANNSITVENFNYANSTVNIDTIKVKTGDDTYQTLSIAEDIIFTKELADNETYTKTTPYREKISLADGATSATVSGLNGNDRIYVADSAEFSRTNNGGLVINNAILITDFFTSGKDLIVNDASTENMTLNVALVNNFSYTATGYNEVFTGVGSVTGITANDNIAISDAQYYRTGNDDVLKVTDGTNTIYVTDFDYTVENERVYVDGTRINYNNAVINVDLNGATYSATGYQEIFTGSGTVSGVSPFDNIVVTNHRFERNGNDNTLIVTNDTNTIRVTDYDFINPNNRVHVNGDEVQYTDTINVKLVENQTYAATNYKEVFTGSGSVSGLTADDNIAMENARFYRTGNEGTLRIANGEATVSVTDFSFNAENTTVKVDGALINKDSTIYVDLDDAEYTATVYSEIFTGTGSVADMSENDKIVVDEGPVYSRENDGGLIINDAITVRNFIFDGLNNINVNSGTTAGMTLNVKLSENFDYEATGYNEIFTGVGSVTGIKSGDNIAITDAEFYRNGNENVLRVTDGENNDISVKGYDFTTGNNSVKVDGTLVNYSNTINVGLVEDQTYTATGYKEIFTGSGTLKNMSNDDKISVEGPKYYRIDNGGLIIRGTDGSEILVDDFKFDGYHDINVNDGTTAGMTIIVKLTSDDIKYEHTAYKEIFGGSGSIDADAVEGDIKVFIDTASPIYERVNLNPNVLIIRGEDTTDVIFIQNYNFDVENTRVYVNDHKITRDDEIQVDLNNLPYTASPYYKEVFYSSGSVSGMDENDNIVIDGAQLYRTGNDQKLTVSNGSVNIEVTDFNFDTENEKIKVNGNLINHNDTVNVNLNGETFAATAYNEVFTGEGILSQISANDKVIVEGDPVYSRTNDGSLFINDTIEVTDFFENGVDIKVNDGTTEGMKLNVTLNNGFVYENTVYREVFTGNGSVSELTADDNIAIENAQFYRSGNSTVLKITNDTNTINVTDYDFNVDNATVKVDGVLVNYNDTINVDLNNSEYDATSYKEIFTGTGTLSGMSENDKIVVDGTPAYSRRNSGGLIINNAITVSDFNWDGAHDININNTKTAGMRVDVFLSDNHNYAATPYTEHFYGSGTISGISADDNIKIAAAKYYRTGNEYTLKISDDKDTIYVTGYNFDTEKTVQVDGHLVDYNDIINVDLNGVTYAGTNYDEVFSGSGTVSGLSTDDKLTFSSTTKYTLTGAGLVITDGTNTITVTDYDYITGNEPAVMVNGLLDDIKNKVLYVTEYPNFDGTLTNFGAINITSTNLNDSYTDSTGNDTINPSLGTDVYNFKLNDSSDIVIGSSDSTKTTLNFEENAELSFSSTGTDNDLIITQKYGDSKGTVTLKDYISQKYDNIYVSNLDTTPTKLLDYLMDPEGDPVVTTGNANTSVPQTIYGSDFNEFLEGGFGNDTIYTAGGNDIVRTGKGNDTVISGEGRKTYEFNIADGVDTLYYTDNNDRMNIKGVNIGGATYTRSGNDLVVTYNSSKNGNDQVVLKDYLAEYKTKNNSMRYIDFANGTDDIFAHQIYYTNKSKGGAVNGTFLDDVITGSKKKDTYNLTQGGNDYVSDKDGDDAYNATVTGTLSVSDKAGKDKYNISIASGGYAGITETKGNDTYSVYSQGALYVYDKDGTDKYNLTVLNGTTLKDKKGNDKYTMTIQNACTITDSTGNDKYTTYINNTGNTTITDNGGNDKYTSTVYSGGNMYVVDSKGNDSFNMNIAGTVTINDKKGSDKYTMTVSNYLNVTDKAGNEKYTITANGGNTYITDSSGNETYKLSGTGNMYITDKKGNDKYTISSAGHMVINESKGNDTYTINMPSSKFVEINDANGKNDKLTLKNVMKNSLIFSININSEGKIADGNLFISTVNANGDYSSVEIDNYFRLTTYNNLRDNGAGKIESIKAANGSVYYTSTMAEKNIDAVKASVASWLSTNGYETSAEVFETGNNEDIASLIAAYNP